ncbi:MAG: hypothetical protein EWM73_02330 [Nitrospira sp.]|nr:MAG: hypothetical protein EWM73_02330 [Nitrospira sp.]
MAAIRVISLFMALGTMVGCASLAGVQERYAVCPYDHAWEAALDAVKDRHASLAGPRQTLLTTS